MCIGNTTSPAASNTNYINWRDDQWESPEVIEPDNRRGGRDSKGGKGNTGGKGSGRRGGSGSQSDRTTGGSY